MKLWKILLATMIALVLVCAVAMAEDCPKSADGRHVTSDWTKISDADCVTDQIDVIYKCTLEGCPDYKKVLQSRVWVEASGHAWRVYGNGKNEAATCTEEGVATYYCVNCWNDGTLNTKTEVLKKIDHDLVKGNQLSKPATCTEPGYDYYKCKNCYTDVYKDTKAAGHNYEEIAGQPANCYAEGYTRHLKCTVCGATDGKTVIPTNDNHTNPQHVTANDKDATCTEEGYEYWNCKDCGKSWTEKTNKIGHDWKKITAKAATCTDDGHNEHSECSVCKATYGKVVVPASGSAHEWKYNGEKKVSCTEDGYKTNKCTLCGAYEKFDVVTKLGHDYDLVVRHQEPTCTAHGWEDKSCSRCGDVKAFEIPKLPHNYVEAGWTERLAATCNSDGVAYRVCTWCNGAEQTKAIPALGHKMSKDPAVVIQPTCTEEGEGWYQCERCNLRETTTIKALGHAKYDQVVAEATCTQPGMKHVWCSRTGCKTPLVERNVLIPATNHKGAKVVVTKEATCTAEGERTVDCPACGKKTEKIAKLAHTYSWVTTPATPSANGKSEYKCACGDVAETKTIKYTKWYYNNTMTSFGPTTKELVGGNDWYRVTPVDLTVDGVYTYDLIASNKYVVGTVTITVNAGALTVNYKALRGVEVNDESLLIYASKADLAAGSAVTAAVGAAINTAETFAGDTNVLVSLVLTGNYDAAGKDYIDADAAAAMIANID